MSGPDQRGLPLLRKDKIWLSASTGPVHASDAGWLQEEESQWNIWEMSPIQQMTLVGKRFMMLLDATIVDGRGEYRSSR